MWQVKWGIWVVPAANRNRSEHTATAYPFCIQPTIRYLRIVSLNNCVQRTNDQWCDKIMYMCAHIYGDCADTLSQNETQMVTQKRI